jgi:uncharacterized protein involved in exopolysaccharide biosynthesis
MSVKSQSQLATLPVADSPHALRSRLAFDVCLELRSKRANKKAVLAERARTLGAAQSFPGLPAASVALTAASDRLKAISSALHAILGDTGETGFNSLARQLRKPSRSIAASLG